MHCPSRHCVVLLLFILTLSIAVAHSSSNNNKKHLSYDLLKRTNGNFQIVDIQSTLNIIDQYTFSTSSAFSSSSFSKNSIHPENYNFKFAAFNHEFEISLYKNHELFADNYIEQELVYRNGIRQYHEERVHRMTKERNCFYHGTSSTMNGDVVIDTCNGGFRGHLYTNEDTMDDYGIEPAYLHMNHEELMSIHSDKIVMPNKNSFSISSQSQQLSFPHVIYRLLDINENSPEMHCGLQWESEDASNTAPTGMEGLMKLPTIKQSHKLHQDQKHKLHHSSSNFHINAAGDGINYVELLLVSDYKRFLQLSSDTETVMTETATLANGIQMIYNRNSNPVLRLDPLIPAVKPVLVGNNVFLTGDPYTVLEGCGDCGYCTCGPNEVSVGILLNAFHNWRSNSGNATPPHDNGHLISGHDFQQAIAGYAGVHQMCNPLSSGGIDQSLYFANEQVMAIVAHEMGHNFGMLHDNVESPSSDPCYYSGFIMNAVMGSTPPEKFSSCSIDDYTSWVLGTSTTCLDNKPTNVWGNASHCGNGFVERPWEDCDCGGNCTEVDPCCNDECHFVSGAACSRLDTCCDETCQIITNTSHICRETANTCDLAEYCDGEKSQCPKNYVKGPGTECIDDNYGSGLCFSGYCSSHNRQCKVDTVRYGDYFSDCDYAKQYTQDINSPWSNNFCGELLCYNSLTQDCSLFDSPTSSGSGSDRLTVAMGVPCRPDEMKQCSSGYSCVSSELLAPNLHWELGSWTPCPTCETPQYTSKSCSTTGDTIIPILLPNEACSPANRPGVMRSCVNFTLNCIDWSRDNTLDLMARELAEKYGALDKARYIRSIYPRIPGYPTKFDIDDSDYTLGVILLIIPGVVLAILSFFSIFIANKCRRHNDKCGGIEPKEGGYDWRERWFPYFILLFLICIAFAFAALGMFYNGELRRGLTHPEVGAKVTISQLILDMLAHADKIKNPLIYLNTSSHDDIVSIRDDLYVKYYKIQGTHTSLTHTHTLWFHSHSHLSLLLLHSHSLSLLSLTFSSLSLSLSSQDYVTFFNTIPLIYDNLNNTLTQMSTITINGIGDSSDLTFDCPDCDTYLISNIADIVAAAPEFHSNAYASVADVATKMQNIVDFMMSILQYYEDEDSARLANAVGRMDHLIKTMNDNKQAVLDWAEFGAKADAYRHPSTQGLFALPIIGFTGLVLAGIFILFAQKDLGKRFIGYGYILFFIILVLLFLLFALHMPLGWVVPSFTSA